MQRVLITGGTGMVGRNLIEHPASSSFDIHSPNRLELDLSNQAACIEYISRMQPDLIIHAAGRVGGIHANNSDPAGYLVENFDMGRNVVLAAREIGVTDLINLGSSCMYPRNAPNPLNEECLLAGSLEPTNEGYALAKIAVARLCDYISQANGVNYRTVIPCNLYGPYDKFDPEVSHLLPAIIYKVHHALMNGHQEVEIWGDGNAQREFMYSGDVADGIWHFVNRIAEMPNMVNLGVGYEHTILEYYQAVADVLEWSGSFKFDLSRPVGMKRKLVSTKRQTALGWSPAISLRDGIQLTYEYFLTQFGIN